MLSFILLFTTARSHTAELLHHSNDNSVLWMELIENTHVLMVGYFHGLVALWDLDKLHRCVLLSITFICHILCVIFCWVETIAIHDPIGIIMFLISCPHKHLLSILSQIARPAHAPVRPGAHVHA